MSATASRGQSLCTTALPVVELPRMPRARLASEVERHQRSRRNALRVHLPQGRAHLARRAASQNREGLAGFRGHLRAA
jgi:hypothetical protein